MYSENLNELLVRIFFVISHIFRKKNLTNEQRVTLAFLFSVRLIYCFDQENSPFFLQKIILNEQRKKKGDMHLVIGF